MTSDGETEARYRRYIDALNGRRLSELEEFVHDELTYNGRPITRHDFERRLLNEIAAVPDLYFNVQLLLATPDLIASRINFRCTPTGELFGLQPNGRTISFSENIFYELRDGRFSALWSVIDEAAIRAQLTA